MMIKIVTIPISTTAQFDMTRLTRMPLRKRLLRCWGKVSRSVKRLLTCSVMMLALAIVIALLIG